MEQKAIVVIMEETRKQMVCFLGEIVEEAKVYADHVQAKSNQNSKTQMALLHISNEDYIRMPKTHLLHVKKHHSLNHQMIIALFNLHHYILMQNRFP